MVGSKTNVLFVKQFPTFEAQITNAKKGLETWLSVLCEYTISYNKDGAKGELRFKKTIYSFELIIKNDTDSIFRVYNVKDPELVSLLKRVIYKSAYCINCEACEVECPTGALSVYPEVKIDKQKCIHCHKCLLFHENGCVVANSLIMRTETNFKGGGISRIGTFGLHEEWLEEYLISPEEFWMDNSLGNKQEQSFKAWIMDAGIINAKKEITEFGQFCVAHYQDEHDLIWELIWVNLSYGSTLTKWFINTISPNQTFSKALLDELALNDFAGTKNSITYAIGGFMQLFKYSPFGDYLEQGVNIAGKDYERKPFNDLSNIAFAYSIYKFAATNNVHTLRVADFYDSNCQTGPAKEFAIPKSTFEKLLRQLNSAKNRLLIAELNMGLDNITLREDLDAMNILKQMVV